MSAERPLTDMSGLLFPNTKPTGNNSPHYTGEVTIRGERLRVAAWTKLGEHGPFWSLAFRPPKDVQAQAPAPGGKEAPK